VLEVLGFWITEPMTVSRSTPHGVNGLGASTNVFPVWFDEWRQNVRRVDTRLAIEQLLRDAWNGGSSVKGGGNQDNVMELTGLPACAPVRVTGEDTFSETSHLERLVLINLPSAGRNRGALAAIEETGEGRVADSLRVRVALRCQGLSWGLHSGAGGRPCCLAAS
jgi:hypothetical protein